MKTSSCSSSIILGEEILVPHPHDVKYGRGYALNFHPGNRFYQDRIQENIQAYKESIGNYDRNMIAAAIFNKVQSRSPPGRFLESRVLNRKEVWYCIAKDKVIRKIKQALRDKYAKRRVSSSPISMSPVASPTPPPSPTEEKFISANWTSQQDANNNQRQQFDQYLINTLHGDILENPNNNGWALPPRATKDKTLTTSNWTPHQDIDNGQVQQFDEYVNNMNDDMFVNSNNHVYTHPPSHHHHFTPMPPLASVSSSQEPPQSTFLSPSTRNLQQQLHDFTKDDVDADVNVPAQSSNMTGEEVQVSPQPYYNFDEIMAASTPAENGQPLSRCSVTWVEIQQLLRDVLE